MDFSEVNPNRETAIIQKAGKPTDSTEAKKSTSKIDLSIAQAVPLPKQSISQSSLDPELTATPLSSAVANLSLHQEVNQVCEAQDWLPDEYQNSFVAQLSPEAAAYCLRGLVNGSYLLRQSQTDPSKVVVTWKSRSSDSIKTLRFSKAEEYSLRMHLTVLNNHLSQASSIASPKLHILQFKKKEALNFSMVKESCALFLGGIHECFMQNHYYEPYVTEPDQSMCKGVKLLVMQDTKFVGQHALQSWVSHFPDLEHLVLIKAEFYNGTPNHCCSELPVSLKVSAAGTCQMSRVIRPSGIFYSSSPADKLIKSGLQLRGQLAVDDDSIRDDFSED